MKNKTVWTKTLAWLMTVAMLMSTMALVLPAAAEAEPMSISLKRVNDTDVIIDGYADDDVWTEIPSNSFARYWGSFPEDQYSYKAAWGTDSAGAAYVYFLIETTDTNKKASTVYLNKSFAKDANWLNGNLGINPDHKAAITTGTEKCVAEYRMALSYLDITGQNAVGATALLNVKITPNSGSEGTINGKNPDTEAVSFILTDEKIASSRDLLRVDDIDIAIDGKVTEEVWDLVPSRSFRRYWGSFPSDLYSYKAVWGTDSDGNAYVYFLIETTDTNRKTSTVYLDKTFAKDANWLTGGVGINQAHKAVIGEDNGKWVVEYRMALSGLSITAQNAACATALLNVKITPNSGSEGTINGKNPDTEAVSFTLTDNRVAVREIKRVFDSQIVIDGYANDEVWNEIPARHFVTYWGGSFPVAQYSYKMLWGTDANDNAYAYFLVETTDANAKKSYVSFNNSFATDADFGGNANMNLGHKGATSKGADKSIAEYRINLPAETTVDSTVLFNIKVTAQSSGEGTFNGKDANGNNISFKLTDERIEIERTMTFVNNETSAVIGTETVIQGMEYTLPTANTEKPFLGWLVSGVLYPAGAKILVTENMTARAMSIGLEMEKGAAVRLTQTTGMRWITYLDEANLPMDIQIISKGTLIVPKDYLTEGVAFTHAGLEAAGRRANQANGYLDVVATEYVPESDLYMNANGRKQFNGSILNIQEGNYDRDFAAVGYVKVKYSNGVEAYIYADYSECVRNVKTIAEAALADETVTFNTAETAVLKKFAGQA